MSALEMFAKKPKTSTDKKDKEENKQAVKAEEVNVSLPQ